MKYILKSKSIFTLFIIMIGAIILVACSNGNTNQGSNTDNNSNKGTEITVLLPYEIPTDMLEEFEDETGIQVKIETSSWDNIQDKIVSALAAGVAPADITEFDWSWIGQFGSAEWYTPLNDALDQEMIDDTPTIENFKYDGDYLGVPFLNDFRISYYNQKYFDEAEISNIPTTMDELQEVAKTIKEKGVVDYPIALPLSATEGTTTGWFTMVSAFDGELFDENWTPLFVEEDSAGYQAMEFIMNIYHDDELIDPASLTLKNIDVYDNFKAGESAIDFAGVPGLFERYTDPEKSDIADDVEVMPVPEVNGEMHTFQLPEALGVPQASENKEAAFEFINWITQPENVKKLYLELEWLPNRLSVLEELNDDGNLAGGDTLLKVITHDTPLFPKGAPPWYSEFSINVSSSMNQMAKGELTVDEGMKKIADSVEKYAE